MDASSEDSVAAVRRLTSDRGAEVVVEATGAAPVALQAVEMAARNGEVILLGTPRRSYQADVLPLLRAVHRANPNVTLKGAHGYSIPQAADPFVKHSVARNAGIVLDLIHRGALKTAPVVTRVAKPAEAADAYRELREHPENSLGVMFDWTS